MGEISITWDVASSLQILQSEINFVYFQAAIVASTIYLMLQFPLLAEKFFLFFIILLESITIYTYLAQMLAYLVPSPALATISASCEL